MKEPIKFKIERAKRMLFGRMLCRLLGDQTGAVLMEYVVVGVLVVAAAVGIVTIFGDTIVEQFDIMITTIVDGSDAGKKKKEEYQQKKQEKKNNVLGNAGAIGNRTPTQTTATGTKQ